MATIDLYKPGQSIDKYCVLKVLSVTRSNHVYVVQGESVHKPQVLKLHAGDASEKSCAMFSKQANLLLEFVSQPTIIDVLHAGTIAPSTQQHTNEQARPFLLMPLYPQTLHDLLAVHHQKLSFITSLHIIRNILDGLHAIHHLGIVHLDIKPQNIFLDEHNNALIGDFDNAIVLTSSPLAKRFSSVEDDPSLPHRATPDYASPEQLLIINADENHYINNDRLHTASDMYSLGMLWGRILTGCALNVASVGVNGQHLSHQQSLHEQLLGCAPTWAIEIIIDLLSHNSEQRPSASPCSLTILANIQSPEVNETLGVDTVEISKNPIKKEDEANQQTPQPKASFKSPKRFMLPIFAIFAVLLYWAYDLQFSDHYNSPSAVKSGAELSAPEQSTSAIKTAEKKSITDIPASKSEVFTSDVLTIDDLNNLEDKNLQGTLVVPNGYTMLLEQHDPGQTISIEWLRINTLPEVRIMATEVTNELFALCAKEGACNPVEQFSTPAKTPTVALPGHPKVNVDWYEITAQFIPWLSQKTQKRFSLPSHKQWLLMSAPYSSANGTSKLAIHCKNCHHGLARQYAGVTMPVRALDPDQSGIYHLFGNAQEWLNDCWQQQSADNTVVQRCDQAMVAGGSWISKQSTLRTQAVSQLLKSAKTPTTGFRLVEWINE